MSTAKFSWNQIEYSEQNQIPLPRCATTCSVYNDCVYILGGYSSSTCNNDFWKFDLKCKFWKKLVNFPMRIGFPASVIYKNFLIVFGGYRNDKGAQNQMLKIDLDKCKKWERVTQKGQLPTPRYGHSLG